MRLQHGESIRGQVVTSAGPVEVLRGTWKERGRNGVEVRVRRSGGESKALLGMKPYPHTPCTSCMAYLHTLGWFQESMGRHIFQVHIGVWAVSHPGEEGSVTPFNQPCWLDDRPQSGDSSDSSTSPARTPALLKPVAVTRLSEVGFH